MTLEEYKELMRFHILMSDKDLYPYSHAAVDESGELYCYTTKPHLHTDGAGSWSNSSQSPSGFGMGFVMISKLPTHKNWKEAVIEL